MKPSEILSAKERLKKLEAEVERLRAHNFDGHAKLLDRAIAIAEIFYRELDRYRRRNQIAEEFRRQLNRVKKCKQ